MITKLIEDNILQLRPVNITESLKVIKALKDIPTQYTFLNNSILIDKDAYDSLVNKGTVVQYKL
jgi:hypothetical protein